MKYFRLMTLTLVISCLNGCEFNFTDIQNIDISNYSEKDKNIQLLEDLIRYDVSYLALKVPALNNKTAEGIKIGYFIRTSDGKTSYRITYNLKNASVAANITKLKQQFNDFIPSLAANHVSNEHLFLELKSVGGGWINSFFNDSPKLLLDGSSTFLKKSTNQENITSLKSKILQKYGQPISTEYLRSEYLEPHGKLMKTILMHYVTSFKKEKNLNIMISMTLENKKWLVAGFNVR